MIASLWPNRAGPSLRIGRPKKCSGSLVLVAALLLLSILRPCLAQRVCRPGWLYVNDKCWNYLMTPLTWDEAEAACSLDEATLASLHAVEESRFLYSLIRKSGLVSLKLSDDPFRPADTVILAQPAPDIACFAKVEKAVLIGFAEVALQSANADDCKIQCLNSQDAYAFQCKSLMYYPDTRDCILNNSDRREQPALFTRETFGENVDYYDNDCGRTAPATPTPGNDCFQEYKNSVLVGFADEVLSGLSRDQCEQDCLQSSAKYGFACNSFLFYRNRPVPVCILNEATKDDSAETLRLFTSDPDADYYQKGGSCGGAVTNPPITAPPGPAECAGRPIDLMFVVDGSGSIGPQSFENIRNFLVEMVNAVNVGPNDASVGLLQFNEQPRPEFSLSAYQTKSQVIDGIRRMDWANGRTMIGEALQYALDVELTREKGDRPTVENVVITLTDGLSQDDPILPADAMRGRGMQTYAIGVTDAVFDEQLLQIAGAPERVFKVKEFTNLDSRLVRALYDQICAGAPVTTPPLTTFPPVRNVEGVWIGLRDQAAPFPPSSNNFQWIDNSPVDYTNWFPNEPNPFPGQDCVAAEYEPFMKWSALPCTQRKGYICKQDPTGPLRDSILPVPPAYLKRYLKARNRKFSRFRGGKPDLTDQIFAA